MTNKILLVLGLIAIALLYTFGCNDKHSIQLPNGQKATLTYGWFDGWDYTDNNTPVVCKSVTEKTWSYYGCSNPDCYRPNSTHEIDTFFFDGEYHVLAYAKIIYEEKK